MLSGSAYIQLMKEIDDMIVMNSYDMKSILDMPPFEFKSYRRIYVDKQNQKQHNG